MGLPHDAQARVVAAVVALPVGVVGDVAGGDSDGVVVLERRVVAGRRVAVVWVQRDAVGAVRVDGGRAADALPDAGGLDGVFLEVFVSRCVRGRERVRWRGRASWLSMSGIGGSRIN